MQNSALLALGLLLAILGALELGKRLGASQAARDPEQARSGLGAIEGASFALLGLLIAFTFSGSTSRFERRKQLVIEEVNDVGTAWHRVDLAPAELQSALRNSFRRYIDARLETYRAMPDLDAANKAHAKTQRLELELWSLGMSGCDTSSSTPRCVLLLPALNAMFDIAAMRRATAQYSHPPTVVFLMLLGLTLLCSLLAGFAMAAAKRRSWLHLFGFALMMSVTTFVIVDLEYPRLGIFRIDPIDQLLVDLRQSMG